VARVCGHLDGIPLALELAASRLRALSTHQLAERLGDRFRLLITADPTSPARQQTLRAAIDWSYQLLTPAEQTALRALSAFPADFDLDAAEAVIGPDGPTDVIFHLVDRSVVTPRHRSGRVRYELLESIRLFVTERAPAGELAEARRRHLDHYTGIVERERRRQTNWDTVGWCRTVVVEEPNLRAAIASALAFSDIDNALRVACGYWVHCLWGGRSEPLDWLISALGTTEGGDPRARCEGLIALAVFTTWWELGPPQRAAALFVEADRLADLSGDANSRARVGYFDAEYRLLRGLHHQAHARYHEAIRIAGDRGIARWCHHSLAWIAIADGDHDRAMLELHQALETGPPEDLVVPHALAALAPLTAAAGRPAQAMTLAVRAVEAAAPFELPGIQVMALLRAAQTRILVRTDRTDARDGDDDLPRTIADLFEHLHRSGIRQFVAEALEVAAVDAVGRGADDDGARYLAAADALQQVRSETTSCLPTLTTIIDRTRADVRRRLGEAAWATIAAEAAATPVGDIVAHARTRLAAPASRHTVRR
jgi:tetratricopeptide (TPR) repeat protein